MDDGCNIIKNKTLVINYLNVLVGRLGWMDRTDFFLLTAKTYFRNYYCFAFTYYVVIVHLNISSM